MLFHALPHTPFSTPLSGSRRETELRLRNLFQDQKRRPPALALALLLLFSLSCGGLVSCQTRRTSALELSMAVQYYDTRGNLLEIPTLVPPESGVLDEGAAAIQQGLEDLAQDYAWTLEHGGESYQSSQCLFYPAETQRYQNLVFFQSDSSYGSDGDIRTWCYDKEEHTQVTVQQALEQSGLSEDLLLSGLEQFLQSDQGEVQGLQRPPEIAGFRIREDGGVVFYLSAYMDDGDGSLDPWHRLYLWEDGSLSRYDYAAQQESPLIPAEETQAQTPPLWSQWYFDKTGPQGGFQMPHTACPLQGTFSSARSAYAAALLAVIQENVLPDGTPLEEGLDYSYDQFALSDVDGDGREELILCHTLSYTAGHQGMVLDWEEATGTLYLQFSEYPLLTFYDNGAITAGASHNQGLGGRFWPYTLYTYDAASDSYRRVGLVDAWDRQLSEEESAVWAGVPPFPEELDTSGTGFLYYIMENGSYHQDPPVDASVYEAWLAQYLGGASELPLTYYSLTQETIQAVLGPS